MQGMKEMKKEYGENVGKLLSIAQIAARFNIGVRTLWRWVASGKFPPPAVRVGRIVRWRASDLGEWIEGQARRNGLVDGDKSGAGGGL